MLNRRLNEVKCLWANALPKHDIPNRTLASMVQRARVGRLLPVTNIVITSARPCCSTKSSCRQRGADAAREVEAPVVDALLKLLSDPLSLFAALPQMTYHADDKQTLIDAAQEFSQCWRRVRPSEHIKMLKNILRRITVSHDGIQITLSRSALFAEWVHEPSPLAQKVRADDNESGGLYEINVPARLKRCGIETKLVIAESTPQDVDGRTRQALQSALARALDRNQKLISGEASSMAAQAKREGVTQRYIGHLLKMAYLAPDIMTAIMKGQIPYDLTLTRLKKGLPLNWAEQRRTLGFTR